ncbi:MAG: hypothetical protein P9L92_06660 [Candidatus Electryonea clarkiae]|nr:hypothetical protein [Candidatus Electryonea clarkiae]MDP8287878.1 hypothetical protein [Candidatus Electryonea clarkiae]
MFTWKIVGLVSTAFVAIGYVADNILRKEDKKSLHLRMTAWWIKIDESRLHTLPAIMANCALKQARKIYKWRFWSWQSLLVSIVISWVFTSIACILGLLLDNTLFLISPIPLPIFTVYLANFPYDLITVIITLNVLFIVSKHRAIVSILAIVVDLLIAFLLTLICFASINFLNDMASNYKLPGSGFSQEYYNNNFLQILKENNEIPPDISVDDITVDMIYDLNFKRELLNSFDQLFNIARYGETTCLSSTSPIVRIPKLDFETHMTGTFSLGWSRLFLCCTTFIPTLIYLSILIVLLIAKLIVLSFMHLLERITEDDPSLKPKEFRPFFLFGLLFSVFATIAKLFGG